MNLKDFVSKMNAEILSFQTGVRKERASLLVWFLLNYFRLDEDAAFDAVCDSDNDKGIDGIFVDDQTEEVYVFQSKYSPYPGNPQGDKDIRDFKGARVWFDSVENIQQLDVSTASKELKSLVIRTDIFEKIASGYSLVMVFVTNKRYNQEATEYLGILRDEIDAWDIDRLYDHYTYAGKDKPVEDRFTFTIDPTNIISYKTSKDIKVTIAPIKANELIKLKGIQDRTLFARNVRYGLGRTRVNKEITKTLSNPSEHENFFLYHNGITLVCSKLEQKENKIIIKNYSIVNGCQSTLSFYESKALLSENINILVRIIQTGDQDRLSQNITYYTNNQNAISLKDLKSNDKVQQDLQIEFNKLFSGEILYKIKSGEDEKGFLRVIENDFAAQLITAFYLKEPHTAHQKAEIFASNYTKIFNRHIDASYIFLLAEMYRAIDEKNILIEDEGIRTYKLTRFFFVYVFRLIFDGDPVGNELLSNPSKFLEKYQSKYFDAFSKLFQLLILDFNYNIKSEKDNNQGYFDYKNSLRNAEKTKEMSAEVVKAYKRHLVHHQEDSFSSLMS